ncbi:ovochymase-2-like [Homarus americanus]|uniref:Prostasin-like n=1 Tax=Homarus americanus TaxID=6706 RepID=A0A8J5K826_HOMAM|nr:ovochymase-2-like [Homarus americanus]KAG7168268.1 Prostasin-like [Homarus americanus]
MWLLVSLTVFLTSHSWASDVHVADKEAHVAARVADSGYNCSCGEAMSYSRIASGSETSLHQYPWVVDLVDYGSIIPFCSGVLVTDRSVLTAAHCISNKTNSDYLIKLGEHDITKVSRVYTRHPDESVLHPDYEDSPRTNDIAIIRFDNPFNFNGPPLLRPICLPGLLDNFNGKEATVVGWGRTSQDSLSSVLLELNLTIHSEEDCFDNLLCAGESGEGICPGDYGGPLMVDVNGRKIIVGIASTGDACSANGSPGNFTEVSHHISWISSQIENDISCADTNTTFTAGYNDATEAPTPMTPTTPATGLGPLACACGKVHNSTPAADLDLIENNPWTVALLYRDTLELLCSATIITDRYVITARRCLKGLTRRKIMVRANAQSLSSTDGVQRKITKILRTGDVALLQMKGRINLVNYNGINPACLSMGNLSFIGVAHHSGYGNLPPSIVSGQVKQVDGNLTDCDDTTYLCFQPLQDPGFCGKDMGGPIVIEMEGRMVLAGIALNDLECTASNDMTYQEVVKLSPLFPWIWDNTQDSSYCGE